MIAEWSESPPPYEEALECPVWDIDTHTQKRQGGPLSGQGTEIKVKQVNKYNICVILILLQFIGFRNSVQSVKIWLMHSILEQKVVGVVRKSTEIFV